MSHTGVCTRHTQRKRNAEKLSQFLFQDFHMHTSKNTLQSGGNSLSSSAEKVSVRVSHIDQQLLFFTYTIVVINKKDFWGTKFLVVKFLFKFFKSW